MSQTGACAVTGTSGYVGSILADELRPHMPVVALVRSPAGENEFAWSLEDAGLAESHLRQHGVKTLVHAAWDMRASTQSEMERICVAGSERLYAAARRAGVERIVFISTISAFDGCRSAYGRTKLAVEKLLLGQEGAVVLRLGLVWGPRAGGVFGNIRLQLQTHRLLPLIGSGDVPQYLLQESTLAETIFRAVRGEFDETRGAPITLAHPRPWPFRDLVRSIAAAEGRTVTLAPVPWPLLYSAARAGEMLGMSLPFRSDSIVSFVYYDKNPDFRQLRELGIEPSPYAPK